MSQEKYQARLDAALASRDRLRATVQQWQGRLIAAQDRLKAVVEECNAKGVPPDKLSLAREQLEAKFVAEITKLEQDLRDLENALAPFTRGGN